MSLDEKIAMMGDGYNPYVGEIRTYRGDARERPGRFTIDFHEYEAGQYNTHKDRIWTMHGQYMKIEFCRSDERPPMVETEKEQFSLLIAILLNVLSFSCAYTVSTSNIPSFSDVVLSLTPKKAVRIPENWSCRQQLRALTDTKRYRGWLEMVLLNCGNM